MERCCWHSVGGTEVRDAFLRISHSELNGLGSHCVLWMLGVPGALYSRVEQLKRGSAAVSSSVCDVTCVLEFCVPMFVFHLCLPCLFVSCCCGMFVFRQCVCQILCASYFQ